MKTFNNICHWVAEKIIYIVMLLVIGYLGYWADKQMVKDAVREVQQEKK